MDEGQEGVRKRIFETYDHGRLDLFPCRAYLEDFAEVPAECFAVDVIAEMAYFVGIRPVQSGCFSLEKPQPFPDRNVIGCSHIFRNVQLGLGLGLRRHRPWSGKILSTLVMRECSNNFILVVRLSRQRPTSSSFVTLPPLREWRGRVDGKDVVC